mmetsp:Transcript_56126/g.166923  ORF Transcript_56126/g.166923 Transcript_56126/m.166923 type:complete len:217 (+) Transcript_56126:719-1369(+)
MLGALHVVEVVLESSARGPRPAGAHSVPGCQRGILRNCLFARPPLLVPVSMRHKGIPAVITFGTLGAQLVIDGERAWVPRWGSSPLLVPPDILGTGYLLRGHPRERVLGVGEAPDAGFAQSRSRCGVTCIPLILEEGDALAMATLKAGGQNLPKARTCLTGRHAGSSRQVRRPGAAGAAAPVRGRRRRGWPPPRSRVLPGLRARRHGPGTGRPPGA